MGEVGCVRRARGVMSYQRISVFAAAGLLVAVFAVPGSTSAAPSLHQKLARHAQVHHWPSSLLRAPLARGHARLPAPIPHVDPRLQVTPPSANGTIEVTLYGKATALAAAVNKVRGRSTASAGDAMTAIVPRSALATLAGTPGVSSVDQPVRAYPDVISEGVAGSNASVWQSAGQNGTGVNVGVVDVGFANLSGEITAGNLPSSQVHYVDNPSDPNNQNHCGDENTTDHGTAVAEIVHQMAPGADLYLYCIDSTVGFQQAEQQIQAAGDIKIVSSSLSFPGDSRGDGTGSATSAATTVKTAHDAGILWIQSAGNNAEDHWRGTLRDANGDGLAELYPTVDPSKADPQSDDVAVFAGGTASFVLQWDHWPLTTSGDAITFEYRQYDCGTGSFIGSLQVSSASAGTSPVLSFTVTNSSSSDACYAVAVALGSGVPPYHFDLSYWGDAEQPSYYAYLNPAAAAAGSITEPASSPYAFGVGATYWQGCAPESFSSRGPTIDGRVKPDIIGFDGVSGNLPGLNPFYGTSAAAPNVAGAAALVAGANPSMDAGQIEDSLDSLAGTSPPNNTVGHGVLNLGAPQTPGQPAVTRVNPASSAVGTTVTISGNGFLAGATTVKFGNVASHHVTVSCGTRLVASVPASAPTGAVPVTVATASGTSAASSADLFTYRPLVAAAVSPKTKGYWLATPQGNVYQFGAPWYGSKGGVSLPAPIVGMAADPATGGYWLVTSKGNVYNFNAPFYGSMAGKALPAPIVGITSSGRGYLLTTSKGNVYQFNAPWYGSMGGKTLPAPIVSITSSGRGYLLTTSKGNVYNFNAPWYGSMAGKSLPGPISGVAPDPATGGYWLTTTKGNVYNFHAPWYGSAAGTSLPAPVVTISTSGAGYVLTTSAGNVLTYNATYHGSPADNG
jgi:Subtilase family/IPT/TIG domain